MQHVPITCQFDVVELDLKPPVISLNALTLFQGKRIRTIFFFLLTFC